MIINYEQIKEEAIEESTNKAHKIVSDFSNQMKECKAKLIEALNCIDIEYLDCTKSGKIEDLADMILDDWEQIGTLTKPDFDAIVQESFPSDYCDAHEHYSRRK